MLDRAKKGSSAYLYRYNHWKRDAHRPAYSGEQKVIIITTERSGRCSHLHAQLVYSIASSNVQYHFNVSAGEPSNYESLDSEYTFFDRPRSQYACKHQLPILGRNDEGSPYTAAIPLNKCEDKGQVILSYIIKS